MPSIGVAELVIVLVIVLVLFGAKRLPELARAMGSSLGELRRGLRDRDASEAEQQQITAAAEPELEDAPVD